MDFELDIQERIIQFAARVVRFCDSVPASAAREQITANLIQTGLRPAAFYGVASSTPSVSEATENLHDAVIALKQNEVWLRIIVSSDLVPESRIEPLLDECQQLQRIIRTTIESVNGATA